MNQEHRQLAACLTVWSWLISLWATPGTAAVPGRSEWKFDFGSGTPGAGYTPVTRNTFYTPELGFGFLGTPKLRSVHHVGDDPLCSDGLTSEEPFLFTLDVPEGNYRVQVTLGDAASASDTTIKAESRRLMVEKVVTAPGEFATRSFTVNVRTPLIAGDGQVRLKPREKGVLHWDHQLTLEFNGSRPWVCALAITRVEEVVTAYLLGDSTVTDQPKEPWNSWGQMLPRFFNAGVAVANHAESGESLKSSLSARRVDKVFSTIRSGDYLFIQFGHNDMKDKTTNALAVYRQNLQRLVERARNRGARPVLVTSMERKAGIQQDTLQGYPQTVREVAQELNTPLIDLHAMSKTLYAALGANLDLAFQDGTHHNNYGSYQLAKCVVEGIRTNRLDLAQFLAEDAASFDPAHPDPPSQFVVPPSPNFSAQKPDGD